MHVNLFQPVRFKLNHSSTRGNNTDKEYSLWVGDLTPDVDDFALYKTFGSRYNSIKTAKGEVQKIILSSVKLLNISLISSHFFKHSWKSVTIMTIISAESP